MSYPTALKLLCVSDGVMVSLKIPGRVKRWSVCVGVCVCVLECVCGGDTHTFCQDLPQTLLLSGHSDGLFRSEFVQPGLMCFLVWAWLHFQRQTEVAAALFPGYVLTDSCAPFAVLSWLQRKHLWSV